MNNIRCRISYTGGDGNDITLTVTNLAARGAAAAVLAGNGNGLIEPDECSLLYLGVENRRNSAITLSNVLLRSAFPATLMTIASAAYPVIPAQSTRTNLTPFQIRTLPIHPCGAPVTVELEVTVAGEGTFAIPFTLAGGTHCPSSGGACESCTIVSGAFVTGTPELPARLLATGGPSICLPAKPCPGPDEGTSADTRSMGVQPRRINRRSSAPGYRRSYAGFTAPSSYSLPERVTMRLALHRITGEVRTSLPSRCKGWPKT
jgi:hypothetical protein